VKGLIISADQFVRAPDGREFPLKPAKRGAEERQLTFALLTGDVDEADWVVYDDPGPSGRQDTVRTFSGGHDWVGGVDTAVD
jgi:hypothetical protein